MGKLFLILQLNRQKEDDMTICDLCKKELGSFQILGLKEEWKTDRVKEVCTDCLSELNNKVLETKKRYTALADRELADWWKAKTQPTESEG